MQNIIPSRVSDKSNTTAQTLAVLGAVVTEAQQAAGNAPADSIGGIVERLKGKLGAVDSDIIAAKVGNHWTILAVQNDTRQSAIDGIGLDVKATFTASGDITQSTHEYDVSGDDLASVLNSAQKDAVNAALVTASKPRTSVKGTIDTLADALYSANKSGVIRFNRAEGTVTLESDSQSNVAAALASITNSPPSTGVIAVVEGDKVTPAGSAAPIMN